MFRPLRLRFFLIVLLLFFALFWDFNKGELRTTIQTGVCEEFDYANRSCQSGPNLIITSYPAMLIDPVALLMVLGLTCLGSWFRDGDLSHKLERASHTAKDAGELAATIGAVISFSGIFFEPSLHMTFRIIFLAYLYGQLLGFTLTTLSNYMKCREEALPENQNRILQIYFVEVMPFKLS